MLGLVALAATSVGVASHVDAGSPPPPPDVVASPSSSNARPIEFTAGDAAVTITFRHDGRARATGALRVALEGTGFVVVADTCTGRSLGPGRACSVAVSPPAQAAAPIRGSLTLHGTAKGVAPTTVWLLTRPSNQPPTSIALSPAAITEGTTGTVGTLLATDPDPADTQHTFTTNTTGFIVSGTSLVAVDPFDFETTATVPVSITATDVGGASLTQTVTVTVLDVDEPPTALHVTTDPTPELAPGVRVGRVWVDDPDTANTFDFTATDPRLEVVDGELRLRSGDVFDFETDTDTVTVELTATDPAGRSVSAIIGIDIVDVNEAPIVQVRLLSAGVRENTPGAQAGSVVAVDLDRNDVVTVRVDDPRFEVVAGTLRLKAGIALDYEREQTVPLRITATDRAGLSTVRTTTVRVVDVVD